MKFTEIAATGCKVSSFGLGTVKFGRNEAVKYPASFELPDDQTIMKLLAIAREFDVNLLDTAPAYGTSEKRLGKLLKATRHEWVISTKVGEKFKNGSSSFSFSPADIEKSIHTSLHNLDTDHIDIVLVHSDGNDEEIIRELDTLSALDNLKKKGLIRCFGVSTKTVRGGLLAVEHSDLAMITYNLANPKEEAVLDHALKLNKGIFIKKALDSGHQRTDMSRTEWLERSMQFVFQHPAVTSIIVGTISTDHLRENLMLAERFRPI
jgi:aryl-alcohol dehydrogenase-like predicted oxidoreductase